MRLKEVSTINAGYPFRGKIPELPDSSVIAVQMRDVLLSEGIRWSACVRTEIAGKRPPGYLMVGDILVAARGSHNYATLIDEGLQATGKQAVAAPHFFVVSLEDESILPEFIVWLLNQMPTQRYFEQNAEGTLTKSIRRSVLEETPVVVPSLEKQKTIVAMAEVLRKKQKLMQQLTQNSERIMSAVANELFAVGR